MGTIIKYKSYEVKTPFHVEDCIREMEINDANGVVLAVVQNVQNSILTNPKRFAKELCAVMRENANRLCHAANGEEVVERIRRLQHISKESEGGLQTFAASGEGEASTENTKEDK